MLVGATRACRNTARSWRSRSLTKRTASSSVAPDQRRDRIIGSQDVVGRNAGPSCVDELAEGDASRSDRQVEAWRYERRWLPAELERHGRQITSRCGHHIATDGRRPREQQMIVNNK
jgi:hypothetical protein